MQLLLRRMGNRVITGPGSQDLDGYGATGSCDTVVGDALQKRSVRPQRLLLRSFFYVRKPFQQE